MTADAAPRDAWPRTRSTARVPAHPAAAAAKPGAVLAVAPEMEKAVVVRDTPDGRTVRTAVLDRALAEAMALREWIEPVSTTGRIRRYRIGAVGRAALKRLMAAEEAPGRALPKRRRRSPSSTATGPSG